MDEKIILLPVKDVEELLKNMESSDSYIMSTALQVFLNKVKNLEPTTDGELCRFYQPRAE